MGTNPRVEHGAPPETPRITAEDVAAAITEEAFTFLGNGRTTICQLTLDNGFMVIGASHSATIEGFDEADGRTYARLDAHRQVYPLLAFRLLDKFATEQRAQAAADAFDRAVPATTMTVPPRAPLVLTPAQSEFVVTTEPDVAIVGGYGSGKTVALLVAAMRLAESGDRFRVSLVLGADFGHMRVLWDAARDALAGAGVRFDAAQYRAVLNCGARIEFAHAGDERARRALQARGFDALCLDAIERWEAGAIIDALALRRAAKLRTNGLANKGFFAASASRRVIKASPAENPGLTPDHAAALASLPECAP